MEKYIVSLEELYDYIFDQLQELDPTSVFDDKDFTRYNNALLRVDVLLQFCSQEEERERIDV